MPRLNRLAATACAALITAMGAAPRPLPAQVSPLVRDLKQLRVPGRVQAVLWTVRDQRITLQVVFPNAGRLAAFLRDTDQLPPAGLPRNLPPKPVVDAWLVRADGSTIQPLSDRTIGTPGNSPFIGHPYGIERLYAFPLAAQGEAVAVALRVDGVLRVEPLALPAGG